MLDNFQEALDCKLDYVEIDVNMATIQDMWIYSKSHINAYFAIDKDKISAATNSHFTNYFSLNVMLEMKTTPLPVNAPTFTLHLRNPQSGDSAVLKILLSNKNVIFTEKSPEVLENFDRR